MANFKISQYTDGSGSAVDTDWLLLERVADGAYYKISRSALIGLLTNHTDVTISSPSTGQVLKYNGSEWVNDTLGVGGGATTLDGLDDVAVTAPSAGQTLRHNGTQFINASLSAADIGDSGAMGRTILQQSSEANFKAAVNLEIGVDVQAFDTELSALAGLTSAANKLPYFTGAGTAATTDFQALARTLLADNTQSGWRSSLGLVTIANTGSASDLATGTVPLARLGTDAPSVNEFLAWDNTWRAPTGGGLTAEVVTGTTYTIDSTSNNKALFFTNTSPIAVTLGGNANDPNGITCHLFWQAATGTITVTGAASPNACVINGLSAGTGIPLTAVAGCASLVPLPTATHARQWQLHGSVGDLLVDDLTDSTPTGRNLVRAADAAAGRGVLTAARTQQDEACFSFVLPAAADFIGDTTLHAEMAHGGTITKVSTIAASGSATLRMKINGVNVGTANNSVGQTLISTLPASANVFAAGSSIAVNIASGATATKLSVTVKYTRTLT